MNPISRPCLNLLAHHSVVRLNEPHRPERIQRNEHFFRSHEPRHLVQRGCELRHDLTGCNPFSAERSSDDPLSGLLLSRISWHVRIHQNVRVQEVRTGHTSPLASNSSSPSSP